jgi:GntR family transcriptional regulator
MSSLNHSLSDPSAPLYRQVADRLIDQIQSGAYQPGDTLPPEDALCQAFGVSRITVRKSIEELLARHLVVRRRGVGTFVNDPRRATKSVSLTGVIDDILPGNQIQVVSESIVTLPAKLVDLFGIETAQWKCIAAVNHVAKNEPLDYAHFYFPVSIADSITGADVAGPLPPIKFLQTQLGVRIDHADQIVEPMKANADIAKRLDIPRGTPVLRAIRIYYDTHANPVEIVDAVYHPERYRYTATLYPRADG